MNCQRPISWHKSIHSRWPLRRTLSLWLVISLVPAVRSQQHLLLGNPSGAKADTTHRCNFLVEKTTYVLSYNELLRTPNWVAWHIDKTWIGHESRSNTFRKDVSLPKTYTKADPKDYEKTGFDKGHMCPSADRTARKEWNESTFLMSNIVPQSPNNNRQTWRMAEEFCRKLVANGKEVYVYAGVFGTGGWGSNGFAKKIGADSINIPSHIWKIVLYLDAGEDDLQRINEHTPVFALWTPNVQEVSSKKWTSYVVSVDFIEAQTGYDFFSALPENIQNILERTLHIPED